MYICDFSRSDGAGSATVRNTRGLTRSVSARMVPPLPAASRPSKIMITRRPLCLTHSWRWQSFAWSFRSSLTYSLFFSFMGSGFLALCFLGTGFVSSKIPLSQMFRDELGHLEHTNLVLTIEYRPE